jgi:hypothetical protein
MCPYLFGFVWISPVLLLRVSCVHSIPLFSCGIKRCPKVEYTFNHWVVLVQYGPYVVESGYVYQHNEIRWTTWSWAQEQYVNASGKNECSDNVALLHTYIGSHSRCDKFCEREICIDLRSGLFVSAFEALQPREHFRHGVACVRVTRWVCERNRLKCRPTNFLVKVMRSVLPWKKSRPNILATPVIFKNLPQSRGPPEGHS